MRVLPRTIILTKLLRLVMLCSGTFKTQAMEKCGWAKSHSIQCINCNISLTLRRPVQTCYIVLEQDTPIVSLISKWISPLIITEEDCICKACFNLAEQTVNEELKGDNDSCKGSSLRGHKQVCLICGRSLAKTKQTHQILSQTSIHHTEIIQIVQNSISPREIQASDRLCHACFVRVERNAIRNKTLDETILIEKKNHRTLYPLKKNKLIL